MSHARHRMWLCPASVRISSCAVGSARGENVGLNTLPRTTDKRWSWEEADLRQIVRFPMSATFGGFLRCFGTHPTNTASHAGKSLSAQNSELLGFELMIAEAPSHACLGQPTYKLNCANLLCRACKPGGGLAWLQGHVGAQMSSKHKGRIATSSMAPGNKTQGPSSIQTQAPSLPQC